MNISKKIFSFRRARVRIDFIISDIDQLDQVDDMNSNVISKRLLCISGLQLLLSLTLTWRASESMIDYRQEIPLQFFFPYNSVSFFLCRLS